VKDHNVLMTGLLAVKMKALWSFKTSATTVPLTQCYILEDLNLHYMVTLKYDLNTTRV